MAELNGVRPVNQINVTISESFFKNLMCRWRRGRC